MSYCIVDTVPTSPPGLLVGGLVGGLVGLLVGAPHPFTPPSSLHTPRYPQTPQLKTTYCNEF